MPKPYSEEFRTRVIEDVLTGASRREAAEHYGISPSVVVIWAQRFEATGSVAAKPSGGSASPLEKHAKFLMSLIAEQPDLTLDEIVAAMRKRKIAGSGSAVWRFFDWHSISFKKTLHAAEQKRADVARARRRWMREQGMFDPARLVFIDETWTNTAMVRLRGRAPRSERLLDYAPHGAWKTVTFVGALRQRGLTAPFVIEGAMNGPMFLAYVKQCLVPTLKWGEIVLMDNLPVHTVAGAAEAIEAAGERRLALVSAIGRQERSDRGFDDRRAGQFLPVGEIGDLPQQFRREIHIHPVAHDPPHVSMPSFGSRATWRATPRIRWRRSRD